MSTTYYGIPTGGHPKAMCLESFVSVANVAKGYFCVAQALLPESRNVLTKLAHGKGCDYLLMQDDDVSVPASAYIALKQILDSDPKVGMAAAIVLRAGPVIPNASLFDPDYGDWSPYPVLAAVVRGMPKEPFPVAGIGTGFCLVRMSALHEVREAYGNKVWKFVEYTDRWGNEGAYGEDIWMGLRLNKLGWKVIADPRHRTVHMKDTGHLVYDPNEWDAGQTIDVSPYAPEDVRFRQINGIYCFDPTWKIRETVSEPQK